MKYIKYLFLVLFISSSISLYASAPTRTYIYASGETVEPSEVTANEDSIFTYLQNGVEVLATNSVSSSSKISDGIITNADISVSAGIVDTKLSTISTADKVNTSALFTSTGSYGDILTHNGADWYNQATGTYGQVYKSGGPAGTNYWEGLSSISVGDTSVDITDSGADEKIEFTVGGAEILEINANGIVSSVQPCVLAKPSSRQENISNSAKATVVFGTEITDQGGDFASNTFTAPVSGNYLITFSIELVNADSAATFYQGTLITSNRNYAYTQNGDTIGTDGWINIPGSVVADMDANDTAYLAIEQGSGTAQTDVEVRSSISITLIN
jgi:hypothetical protein